LAPLPQHPDQHRSERPVLLAVDQQLSEGPALRVAPELSDPVGSLQVREHEDVEKLGAESDPAMLRVLLKVKPGLGEGYDWVTCGACDAG
jgi:hypothetical protein